MWNHWAIRTNYPYQPFKDFHTARWAWSHLASLFPEMLAGVLMPNHVHLILPALLSPTSLTAASLLPTPLAFIPLPPSPPAAQTSSPTQASQMEQTTLALRGFMAAVSLREGQQQYWQPIPPPSLIPPDKLALNIRYVALNPCRKKLCSDPLDWYWSTYREIMGTCMPSFGRLGSSITSSMAYSRREARTIQGLREPRQGFRVRFHSYVSADPSVSVTGTPFPKAAPPTNEWANHPLEEILAAAAGALRVSPMQVRTRGPLRTLFTQLAYRHGWRKHTPLLAKITATTEGSIRRTLKHPPPSEIEAADLCLGDSRLRMKVSLNNILK